MTPIGGKLFGVDWTPEQWTAAAEEINAPPSMAGAIELAKEWRKKWPDSAPEPASHCQWYDQVAVDVRRLFVEQTSVINP